MDIKYIVPSYQRENQIEKKTLSFFESQNISPDKVQIWVANQKEYEKYGQKLFRNPYGSNIKIGVKGLAKQRNLIEQEISKEGDRIVFFDDDIRDVKIKVGERLEKITDFENQVAKVGFEEIENNNCNLWGINASANPFFMKDKPNVGLHYICGCLFGVKIQKTQNLIRQQEHGEDFEYTLMQYSHNGAVVRLDHIAAVTTYYAKGGLEEHRKNNDMRDEMEKIVKRYPNLARVYTKKDGKANIRLIKPKKR